MDTSDAMLAERNDYSADSSSDDEDRLSCASSDVGSEWTVPEPRLPTKGFSYKYRSDIDAEKFVEQITNRKDDTMNFLTEHDFAVKDADKLSPDCGSIAPSLSTKVSSRTMPLPSPTNDHTNDKGEMDSDSDSLESLSSSGSMMDESEVENDALSEASSPALGNFANHALLQYHLKNAQLSTTRDRSSRNSAIHNRSNPTPSGQKQKRQRTASTASAEERNTTNSSSQGRKMIVETSADRDAYILQRALRWEQRGVRFDWQSVARFLRIPVQTVRQRYAELTGAPLDTVPAILIPRRPTKTKTIIDLSCPEGQNEYIIRRIEQWHVNKQKFHWETLMTTLGWTRQATKNRVYKLMKEGSIDSALVPSETEPIKLTLGMEPTEAQDKFLLEQVALAKSQKHGNMWDMIGKKLGCTDRTARRRYTFLMSSMFDPLATCADSTITTVTDTAIDTITCTTSNTTTTTTTDHCTVQPAHDIIDLTEEAVENAHASQMGDLETYILYCVRQQLWLLLPDNILTSLWRQLGVELGLREIELQAMWQDKLRSVFLKSYNAAITQGAQLSAPPQLQLTHEQCTWLCAQVYAWRGRGRGLWEGLSRVLNAPPVQVMCLWSMLTPENVQYRWVEDAVSQRLLRKQGRGCNTWSSTQENTSSRHVSSEALPKRVFDVYKTLQSQQETSYRGQSSLYFVDECVDQMLSAIEKTDTVDRNSTLLTTPTAVAATSSSGICDAAVQHTNLSPSRVFYDSAEISTFVLHYIHDQTAAGHEISWPYIANRMKISEIALRVMYEEFLQRKKQLHNSLNRSTVNVAQPVVAAVPPARDVAPPAAPVVVLDPSVVRWHEERVRLKAVPRSGKTHHHVKNHTGKPVQRTGVEESIHPPLFHSSNPLQQPRVGTQGPVQPQHYPQLRGPQSVAQRVQHQQLSQKDQILRTDQAILHAAHTARASGINIDWMSLSQHLGCSVFELQSRYLNLLSVLQC